ncbi:MAG: hypothetical protein KME25_24080 [Symplocastrum torsivum CPER-KK1]|uniref:Uncharacterized protein n=1 Tax=Symplocastrum torsivum CPER-KK1 TaxID=450513 RepID=A0A951PPP5_9CYAN|nr:hypothetical protein [Symplocastrum torsivum CPER-KK1]
MAGVLVQRGESFSLVLKTKQTSLLHTGELFLPTCTSLEVIPTTLITTVDTALYQAKSSGRDRAVCHLGDRLFLNPYLS